MRPIEGSDSDTCFFPRSFLFRYYTKQRGRKEHFRDSFWTNEQGAKRVVPLVTFTKMIMDGIPRIYIDNSVWNLGNVYYELHRLDEETDQMIRLGRTPCRGMQDETTGLLAMWRANGPMHWPCINGIPCDIELKSEADFHYLYGIPVLMGRDVWYLRCCRTYAAPWEARMWADEIVDFSSSYEIYGVWEGYDDDSVLPTRNVKVLAQVVGQDFRVIYPVKDTNGRDYRPTPPMTFTRGLEVEENALPPGTYTITYEVDDMFMRPYMLEPITVYWDGEQMSFPVSFSWGNDIELMYAGKKK